MDKKGDKPGSIIKDNYNKSGSGLSIDQLQSYQPILVSQLSGKSQVHKFGPPK